MNAIVLIKSAYVEIEWYVYDAHEEDGGYIVGTKAIRLSCLQSGEEIFSKFPDLNDLTKTTAELHGQGTVAFNPSHIVKFDPII